ncbi:hypothetical protein Tco_0510978 [Tanacetum coccineum]
MANLEFCDKHDMVTYLQKPEGSEAFHQIMDFLNTSHIKYALIENPKIYISLIQQFWGTATARTTDDGEVEITASIDGQVKTITEASLRRHLSWKTLMAAEIPQYQFPTQTLVVDKATFTSVDVDAGGAATTDIGLEVDMEYDFDVSTVEGFTTANVPVTTASATPKVSTAAENLVYIRRSAEKRKDKGIAIMKEDEFVQKKTKKQLEKERLGHEEAVRLQEQINEEERQRIARDA